VDRRSISFFEILSFKRKTIF